MADKAEKNEAVEAEQEAPKKAAAPATGDAYA